MSRKNVMVIAVVVLLAVAAGAGYMTRDRWMHAVSSGSKTVDGFTVVTKDGVKYKECYVCPMHPQVVKPGPGDCPICGMTLVPKLIPLEGEKPASGAGHEGHEMPMPEVTEEVRQVTLDPRERVLANVKTETVRVRDLSEDVYAVGRVAYNEESIRVAAAWYPGRVERMHVLYEGQVVRKGERIMSIYSPELVSAQKEYLIASDAAGRLDTSGFPELSGGSRGVADAARARLLQWGMTGEQVDRLADTKAPVTTLDVYSPVSGTVNKLFVRGGDYVMEGSQLFSVADLGTVWVNAELYEFEFGKASLGAAVEVTADAFPGEVFRGKVSFIDPTVNNESRTVRVRVELSNRGGRLKPGMFVNAKLFSRPRRSVAAPASAVLYTGRHNVVWTEEEPGVYKSREVTLGERAGEYFAVKSGLVDGDTVVSEGGFLLDSEAQLKASAGGASMPGMEMGGGEEMKDNGNMPAGHRH